MIENFFSAGRHSSGGRIRMYERMRPIAERLQNTLLVSRINVSLSHERYTEEQESAWDTSSDRKVYVEKVRAWDVVADPLLSSIRNINESQVQGLPDNDPLVAAAERIRQCVYPGGIAAVTALPFEDQVTAMERMVAKLQAELAPDVALLGLGGRVARLAEVTAAYRQAVNDVPRQVLFAPVQAARDRGHRLFLHVLAIIFASYYDENDPVHMSARAELLAPVLELEHSHRVRLRARRRGQVGDEAGAGDVGDAGDAGDGTSDSAEPAGTPDGDEGTEETGSE